MIQPPNQEALRERMERLARKLADRGTGLSFDLIDEAREIVAQLPPPVDPDLVEAREVCVATTDRPWYSWRIREGAHDREFPMRLALAALARGRELQRREQ